MPQEQQAAQPTQNMAKKRPANRPTRKVTKEKPTAQSAPNKAKEQQPEQSLRKISKEELADLPTKEFAGYAVPVINEEQAQIAVCQIREAGVSVGFDTETRPAFQKGVSYKVALVQLSVGQVCYLFRLHKIGGLPQCLLELLEDASVQKIGLSTHDDFQNLRKWTPSLRPQGFIELQQLVTRYGIGEQSLTKIYALLFGQKLSKRQRLTNWEADQLSPRQQAYAALDAVACVEIYDELMKK